MRELPFRLSAPPVSRTVQGAPDVTRVVRVIQPDPRAPGDTLDIRFPEFTVLAQVPLPVRRVTHRNGRLVETVEISQISVNPRLSARAFDLNRWRAD